MSRPDLATPEGRAAYQAELRTVAVPWRVGGIAMIMVAAIVLVSAKGQNMGLHSPLMIAGFAILAVGWILAFVGIYLRTRYHALRLKEPAQE
jgi:uncharacterized membrane protein YkgB